MFGGGTAVKYKATKGTDSFNKYGRTVNVNTILHCITAAISYSQKSIEELRFEDYSAGLKGPSGANGSTERRRCRQLQTTNTGLIGGLEQRAGSLGAGILGIGVTGTAVKYKATKGTDSFNKYGSTVHVNTTMHCITAANNYSWKSMEELRFEDYSAGRKGSSGANGGTAGQSGERGGLLTQTTNTGRLRVGSLIGSGIFGGTVGKYKATKGTDSFNKNGLTVHVNTTMHCITAANNYSWKSIEELRFEDYSVGRKGPSVDSLGSLHGLQHSTKAIMKTELGMPYQKTSSRIHFHDHNWTSHQVPSTQQQVPGSYPTHQQSTTQKTVCDAAAVVHEHACTDASTMHTAGVQVGRSLQDVELNSIADQLEEVVITEADS